MHRYGKLSIIQTDSESFVICNWPELFLPGAYLAGADPEGAYAPPPKITLNMVETSFEALRKPEMAKKNWIKREVSFKQKAYKIQILPKN